MEFATLFSALGSRVTIVEILDSILTGLEPELVRNLKRVLDKQGMRVLTKSTIEEIHPKEEKLILTVKTPQGIQEVTAEKLLIAVGRAPNLNLDFSKAGVETTSIGIQVNQRMETTCSHIYAIGDVTGGPLLAHVASEEGIVAVENLMGIDRKFENRWIPACIFTDPEIASVGLTEKEAKTKGGIKIGRFPFRSNPRALISGETEGLIKVIASRETDELLGVHIIGSEASDLISIASSILRQGGRTKDFSQIIQAHPTLPEALKEACLDAEGMAIHLSSPLRERKG
jgi:dihydrolipoamide dehydrogenase